MGISVHGDRCTDICEAGQQLIDERNHHADSIAQRCEQLRNKMYNLGELANVRKTNLLDNSAYLQFMWKADVVESWIADKEAHVRSDEFGRDLSSVQTLLTKQETFDIGLRAFETEGIQNISALKEQLISGNHVQAEAINKKFNEVIARWNRLLSDSAGREQRLLDVQDQFRQIEELYLTFAKKASAFNSWFTMEALADTWKNLQSIIKQRDSELAQEEVRQEENDKLRKEFARHANAFYQWLTETRAQMMEGSGTLEEQLAAVGIKAHEVAGRASDLRKIEDLGAILEEKLILDNRYTEHSTVGLAQQWDQLNQLGMRIRHNLEQQIQARNQCGVAEDQLKEFSMMFRHFDKDKSGKLTHDEFKSCLRALGYDLPVAEEEGEEEPEFDAILAIVDPNKDGSVQLQDYMAFMISKETENVQSYEDVENAF